jgi:ribonuclease HII
MAESNTTAERMLQDSKKLSRYYKILLYHNIKQVCKIAVEKLSDYRLLLKDNKKKYRKIARFIPED